MIIKDIVYGDIEIPDAFKAIIDTPEFQRLRRIKQLATANLVFPAANHTRFEHSIGAFHVMRRIVCHFLEFYKKLDKNISFDKKDIDAVLMAALLHDIGHGPFSHAFEQALEDFFNHEAMTVKIITDRETEINKRLREQFGADFPEKVVEYLDIRNEHKGSSQTEENSGGNRDNENTDGNTIYKDIIWIFRYLVSSQLDADRIDYILRDSKALGVQFGNFDINDLIAGMQITFYNDNYHVCITEKHLPFVEGYLFARYQMYRNVYMDTYKIFTEELLRKIIKLAKESYDNGSIDKNPIIIPMFSRSAMTVKDFCGLDDHVLMGSILEWSTGVDKILSMLCKAFLDRAGFDRLDLLENRKEDILLYKKKFLEICGKYINLPESTSIEECGIFESFYFWVENIRYFSLYNDELTKIYFQCDNGLIKELVEISPFSAGKKESRCANYIHYGLLRLYYEDNKKRENKAGFDLFLSDVQKLIDSFSPRRQLEIESKYVINHDDEKIFSDVIDFIKTKKGYVISEASVFYQKDTYFDYKDNELFKSGKSIRMRSKKDKYVVTYKETIADFDAKRMSNQTIRIEREIEMDNPDIIAGWPEIKKSLPELALIEERKLAEILVVENNRTKYNLSNGNFQIELVLDDVVYSRENSQKHREKHIEIELLSSYEYRINLKLFTELLETHFGGRLIANSRSKLERGLSFCQSMAKT